MAHYTLRSGQRSETVTSRCPTCLKVTMHSSTAILDDCTVCCSLSCYSTYYANLIALWERAQEWGKTQQKYGNEIDIFNLYMIEVGH